MNKSTTHSGCEWCVWPMQDGDGSDVVQGGESAGVLTTAEHIISAVTGVARTDFSWFGKEVFASLAALSPDS
jgi:hypothetical protein